MTSIVRHVRRRSAVADKVAYLARVHRASGRDPVLVFTMGKVGSTALSEMVRSATGRSVLHFHRASRAGIRRSTRLWRTEGAGRRPHEEWRGSYARVRVRVDRRVPRWDLLTGVRDPMAQLVSATFQIGPDLALFDADAPAADVDLDRITDRLLEFARTGNPWRWFEDELTPLTGIDVMAEPFAVADGYATYENDRFRVLLIRTEDLERVAPAASADFFGLDRPATLPRRNVGATKVYSDLYRRFVDEAVLPIELLDGAYGCSMATHFYTPAELDAFRSRWQQR